MLYRNSPIPQIRQGDVFLNLVPALPAAAKPKPLDGKRVILAYGEVTGHAHAIEASPDVEAYEFEGRTYLRILGPVDLVHEEHGHHKPGEIIPPGVYEIPPQCELEGGMAFRTKD